MNTETEQLTITANVVKADQIQAILEKVAPAAPAMLQGLIFRFAAQLMPAYRGGMWGFRVLSNGGFYMVPPCEEPVTVQWKGNYFQGQMSVDAAGVVTTLFALGALWECLQESEGSDLIADACSALRSYGAHHAESDLIFAAID